MTTLELIREEEIEACGAILEEGRQFQRQQGFVQWTEDYPNTDTVRQDFRQGKGYAVKVDGAVAGYMCVDFDGDPAYAEIRGSWKTEEPYGVVHRLALSGAFRGIGLADTTFDLIKDLCRSKGIRALRADTDFPNKRMQHILEKNGFKNCGVISFHGDKLAYEQAL